jgi:hypothetical protein
MSGSLMLRVLELRGLVDEQAAQFKRIDTAWKYFLEHRDSPSASEALRVAIAEKVRS